MEAVLELEPVIVEKQRLNEVLNFYTQQMKQHPLKKIFSGRNVSRKLVNEYASIQYIDSVLWVPMLAIMKDRVKNTRLRQALLDNLLCEAGARHESHVTLCQSFIKSLGIAPFYGNFHHYSHLASHPIEMMNAVSGMSEAQIAGMNYASEALVPYLFKMVLPAIQRIDGANPDYLIEHIAVDADEHAKAMEESIDSLLIEGTDIEQLLDGIHLGARTALSVPDALYAKYLRGAYPEK